MTIKDLKEKLENAEWYFNSLLIFSGADSDFLKSQYLNQLIKTQKRKVQHLTSIDALNCICEEAAYSVDMFDSGIDENLYLYSCDEFNFDNSLLNRVANIIILCNKLTTETHSLFAQSVVEFPILADWQIKDFAYSRMEGVKPIKIDWLLNCCKNSLYRLDSELSKIELFDISERDTVFELFVNEGAYDDIHQGIIFDLSNAITTNNFKQTADILLSMECEPMALQALLVNNFRNIIKVQLKKDATAANTGLSGKQFYAIQKNCGRFKPEQLVEIFKRLIKIEGDLKTGRISSSNMIDYILLSVFSA